MPTAKNNLQDNWITVNSDMTEKGIEHSFWSILKFRLGKDKYTATKEDKFMALATALRDRLIERWLNSQEAFHKSNTKRVYYLSLEFLIGKLFETNMLNLGLQEEITKVADDVGISIEDLMECEPDAGLGNGGLGRLAACFMDSMATLGIPAHGYGIRYDYGIFKQKIINGNQVEFPDAWFDKSDPWEFARPEYTVKVRLFGHTRMFNDKQGKLCVEWIDTKDIFAKPYDIPVVGYENDFANTLRLWAAHSSNEFELDYFNHGDYERAMIDKVFSEIISKVLYPGDAAYRGKILRLTQEYFFSAASISDIIRRFKTENSDLRLLPTKAVIQLNDTHPSIAIAEMMRILIDEEGMEWESAWKITRDTFAYTNHTVMPEALEKWPVSTFQQVLPRHLELIYEINRRFLDEVSVRFPGDMDRLSRMSIIEEGNPKMVRMAYLAIIGSHSINGVSKLHSRLLREDLFKDFYEMFPENFNNKTNGITQRRWLLKSNKGLSRLITESIGNKWITDLSQTKKLLDFVKDNSFCKKWQQIKKENKQALADFIYKANNIRVNPDSIFDVQVKRIHEYKRQLLLCVYIVSQYLMIKNNPKSSFVPRTFIFAGKAAPEYFMAKRIIKFINNIAEVINKDKDIDDKLKVVFLEDYRVSLAERIFPASDLSEQISTAGTEASGTGCMKFMLNGALTIGTYDGANIEICEEVGEDNIFIFGLRVDEIKKIRQKGYWPQDYINRSQSLGEAIRFIQNNFFCLQEPDLFKPLADNLIYSDPYLICADFDNYCQTQEKVSKNYLDSASWTKKSIINVAKSGKFSSDRTIKEYAKDIWDVAINDPLNQKKKK
ncbi:MAG: glycogen/starch/alpha-glucan phosphorylase [Candidatus Omnitrophica bacterium]|nr:glycogen/starch/alpha-glucan phosphorylase [Candidatus Omnitrophota bacterium]